MTPFVTAGSGFLLAVLWFDLMHDVQVLGARPPVAEAVESIARYYRRVTTDARPMNRLVAAVMLATLASLVAQLAGTDTSNIVAAISLTLAAVPIALAAARTVPNAVRLGRRAGTIDDQVRLAQLILRDHLCCLVAIVALLTVQLGFAR